MERKVVVYGGGLIGSGWAAAFLLGGIDVTVYDISGGCLENTRARMRVLLERVSRMAPEAVPEEQVETYLRRVHYTCDAEEAVTGAAFIQENGPERLQVKQGMIETIERYNSSAVIATSTSGQRVTEIAANAKHPERILAGHPFNPVHLMPLVELCGGEKTSGEAVEKAYRLYSEIGKMPIVLKKECKGFVGNRLQAALNREVQDLVARGVCSVEDADRAVTYGLGMRLGLIGPHMVFELAGGEGGIAACLTKFEVSKELLADLAAWDVRPKEYYQMAVEGARAELAARPREMGDTHGGLEEFRDAGLLTLLKYHGLLKKWEGD